jgi:hypothetical protein
MEYIGGERKRLLGMAREQRGDGSGDGSGEGGGGGGGGDGDGGGGNSNSSNNNNSDDNSSSDSNIRNNNNNRSTLTPLSQSQLPRAHPLDTALRHTGSADIGFEAGAPLDTVPLPGSKAISTLFWVVPTGK